MYFSRSKTRFEVLFGMLKRNIFLDKESIQDIVISLESIGIFLLFLKLPVIGLSKKYYLYSRQIDSGSKGH